MDKTLASLPISVLELDYPSLEKTTPDGEAILNTLILQKKKLKTVKNINLLKQLLNYLSLVVLGTNQR